YLYALAAAARVEPRRAVSGCRTMVRPEPLARTWLRWRRVRGAARRLRHRGPARSAVRARSRPRRRRTPDREGRRGSRPRLRPDDRRRRRQRGHLVPRLRLGARRARCPTARRAASAAWEGSGLIEEGAWRCAPIGRLSPSTNLWINE